MTRGLKGEPPAGVLSLHADRDDRSALAEVLDGIVPDGVIDTSCYEVAGARAAAEVLGDAPSYAFVSSISAYHDWPPGPVRSEDDPTFRADADLSDYGPMKAESERVLGAALGESLLSARAGLIIGRGDRTRRLTSWIHRIATQDRVVVPAEQDQPIAFIDVRDLATFLVDAVEQQLSGPVNATGPVGMTTYGGMLDACCAAVRSLGGRPAELVPITEERLLAAGVEPWRHLPFWLARDVAATAWQVDTTRARTLGVPTRPVQESVLDAWRWVHESGFEHDRHPGADVEERLLAEA